MTKLHMLRYQTVLFQTHKMYVQPFMKLKHITSTMQLEGPSGKYSFPQPWITVIRTELSHVQPYNFACLKAYYMPKQFHIMKQGTKHTLRHIYT